MCVVSTCPESSKKSLIYFEIVCAGDIGFVQESKRGKGCVCVCVCVWFHRALYFLKEPYIF